MRALLSRIARDRGETGEGTLIETGSGATLMLGRELVVKLHREGTDGGVLARRLQSARSAGGCLLLPLTPEPLPVDGDRWVTVWPRVEPVSAERPEQAPWAAAGTLLARLHRTGPPVSGPDHGAVARLERALGQLQAVRTGAADVVRAAAQRLPAAARYPGTPGRPRTLVHGDWHLGQVGRRPGSGWVLLDLDDLGLGDPAWDLARPAGFSAAGLLPDGDWRAFLDGYRGAGGPAVPADGDPWPALDAAARAAVVQSAAAGLTRAHRQGDEPDEIDQALVEACARMA